MRMLLPLCELPADDLNAWEAAATLGDDAVAVVNIGGTGADAGHGAREGAHRHSTYDLTLAVSGLTGAGAAVLGYVSLGFATGPVTRLANEIAQWAATGATGVFLDHAPAGPFQLGALRLAHRAAMRAGMTTVVVNPGGPADPLCREFATTLCTFEGTWEQYEEWSGEGSAPGDGHLVHGVPVEHWASTYHRMRDREAGLGLITEPVWPMPVDVAVAGTSGRSTTSGS